MRKAVDTTFVTVTTSTVPFTINQRNLTIENRDSMAYGLIPSSLPTSVTYVGASLVYRQTDAWDEDEWTTYSSSDSIDFTKPMDFRVYSVDPTIYQTYSVKVNVHQQPTDSMAWFDYGTISCLETVDSLNIVQFQDSMAILSIHNGVVSMTKCGRTVVGEAVVNGVVDLPANIIVSSMRSNEQNMYVADADGNLYCSEDGGWEWNNIYSRSGFRFVAVSQFRLYGICDSEFVTALAKNEEMSDEDWMVESKDYSNVDSLPQKNICSSYFVQTNSLKRVLVAGNSEDGSPLIWSKVWNSQEDNAEWVFYPYSADNKYWMPRMKSLNIMRYGDTSLLVGDMADGSGLSNIYVSRDQGITWKVFPELHWPGGIKGTKGAMSATVDSEDFLWLIQNGHLIKGRTNYLGFDRDSY